MMMMIALWFLVTFVVLFAVIMKDGVDGLVRQPSQPPRRHSVRNHHHHHHDCSPSPQTSLDIASNTEGGPLQQQRRRFLQLSASSVVTASASLTASFLWGSQPALAGDGNPAATSASSKLPLITTDEFGIILRDSAQAIQVVEFSGPKSETVTVRLVDGTAFGLSDVLESPVDPRSPLKISAMCRENKVPTKFVFLEAALASAPKRNVMYTNERVLKAAEKEREKRARIEQDETNRLAELFRFQQQGQQPESQ